MFEGRQACVEQTLTLLDAANRASQVRLRADASLAERPRNTYRSALSRVRGECGFVGTRPVARDDFSLWSMPALEHQFDGIRIITVGPCGHGRLVSDESGPVVGESDDLVTGRFDALINHFAAFEIFALEKAIHIGSPSDLPVSEVESGEGSIDTIDDSAAASEVTVGALVSVVGWMAVSVEKGVLPDAVYVTLTNQDGQVVYVKARRAARTDVAAHFNQPKLRESGFVAIFPSSRMRGNLILGLAREREGRIELCRNFRILLRRGADFPRDSESSPAIQSLKGPNESVKRRIQRRIKSLFGRGASGR
jgi:hypothetical protein